MKLSNWRFQFWSIFIQIKHHNQVVLLWSWLWKSLGLLNYVNTNPLFSVCSSEHSVWPPLLPLPLLPTHFAAIDYLSKPYYCQSHSTEAIRECFFLDWMWATWIIWTWYPVGCNTSQSWSSPLLFGAFARCINLWFWQHLCETPTDSDGADLVQG